MVPYHLEIAKRIVGWHRCADVVTANNVFSHADDLRGMLRAIKSMMKPDGVFVFEVGYLGDLVKNKLVDYIYHEHLAHHSVRPLRQFLASEGMSLFHVKRIPTKGGSIRCFAARNEASYEVRPSVQLMIGDEVLGRLYCHATYARLGAEFQAIGAELHAFCDDEIQRRDAARANDLAIHRATFASYGASATATVLNAMFDINKYFSFIVDDNPARHGRLSPGARILVKPRSALVDLMPTYTIISSWRFADMIIARNQDYLAAGGKFIVPLPTLRVVE